MKNVGGLDRLFRFLAAFILLSLPFVLESNWRYIGLLGFVFLFNGVTKFCFVNRMLGRNTCKAK